MTFTQLSFLSAFLPLFLLAGILTRGKRISPNFHIASGLIFLLLWGVVPAAIFVGFIALNALVMGLKGKTRVIWAVLLNLGFIALYKLLPFWGRESWSFHVPLGISYAALQALSFHINQEKGSVVQLAHYLLFLPKLPMGPITAYQDFVNQPQERAERLEDLYQGLCRIILGLSKKLLVADRLALLTQTLKTAAPQDQGIALAVLAALIFPLQSTLIFPAIPTSRWAWRARWVTGCRRTSASPSARKACGISGAAGTKASQTGLAGMYISRWAARAGGQRALR